MQNFESRIGIFFQSFLRIKVVRLIIPWLLFLAMLAWTWRIKDPFREIPFYGDVFEVLWGIRWYGDHFFSGRWLYDPLVFYPEGWQVITFAYGPALFLAMLPLYAFGGAAFAYNVACVLSAPACICSPRERPNLYLWLHLPRSCLLSGASAGSASPDT